MSSAQSLREFIRERLTAAAAEIFSEFEQTIVRYEEEIDRQRRLLEISWKPQINLHRIELPLHYVRTDEEVLTDQLLWNQERTSSLDQEQPEPLHEGPDPPQMKVEQDDPEPLQVLEQEELCISQDEEQFILKQETVTSLVTPADEDRDHHEPEPDRHQLLLSLLPEAEIRAAAAVPGSAACPELAQHHFWEKVEVLTDQQISDQESTFSLDMKQPEPPLIRKEQQELRIHQQEGPFILKQENVTFILNYSLEETDSCKPEPNRNQPLCQSSTEDENQYQEGCRNENSESKSNEDLTQNKISQQTKDLGDSVECQELIMHKRAHRDRSFSCKLCGKSFNYKCLLNLHLRTHTGEKPFTCDACGKNFTDSGSLTKHSRTHTGEKPYPCEMCGKCFSRSDHLTDHMRTHTGEKSYPCKTCGKFFTYSSNLTKHMRSHTGEKPYRCGMCHKRFSCGGDLTKHMRTHTGEKPYLCEICGKCFSRSDQLTDHTRTHTGEKPHPCKTCGKSFTVSSNLASHMRTHTGEKPHECKICGKCFTGSGKLTSHMRSHTGEKPYPCGICGKCFSQSCSLTKHVKTQHK